MSDAFAPDTGQTVDAAGRVTHNFTGKIHAVGLELDITTFAGSPDFSVRWLAPGGAAGATINTVQALEFFGGPAISNSLALLSASPDNHRAAQLYMTAADIAADSSIRVAVAGGFHTLLDGTGQSEFLQLLTLAQIKLQFGNTSPVAVLADPGPQTFTVPLPTPWGNAHTVFLSSAAPTDSSDGVLFSSCRPNGLDEGIVTLVNTDVDQGIVFGWISLGF